MICGFDCPFVLGTWWGVCVHDAATVGVGPVGLASVEWSV